ncbi:MAG: Rab family GTPase [Candidatus Thorarchaeota archaeon]
MGVATPDFVHKIVFLGDSMVGKTSLVDRYVYDSLSPQTARTIGAMLHVKVAKHQEETIKLVIWDLGGQESFAALREQYCSNAAGAFLVVDITRPETLANIDSWLSSLYTAAGQVPVILVANKIDLKPVITDAQLKGLADVRGLRLIRTSATENQNVDEAFTELVAEVQNRARSRD